MGIEHEPEKGKFDFSGNNDIAAFIKTAQEEHLWVLLRPSPYVCAEWEFGGYPYWLQNEKGLKVRSKETQYLKEYRNYINRLGQELAPLLVTNGGNILMVQVENEYGAYGADKDYLAINRELFIDAGFNCLLNTCDPADAIERGNIPGLLPAVNGLTSPEKIKQTINKVNNGHGPYFIAEWYPAWFDWWGEPHHTVAAEKYARQLDSILAAGISINMYMFHGGTTRGFMNGANWYDSSYYQPQVSRYDYDAPLDEAGNATKKFMVFRDVIARHLPKYSLLPPMFTPKPAITLPPIVFKEQTSLTDMLPTPKESKKPLTFEELGQAYGYVLYRTTLKSGASGMLKLKDLRDYAIVFVNGKRQGILDRMKKQDSLRITVPPGEGEATLDILVENMGRINYGPNLLKNTKGITQMVTLDQKDLKGWKMYGFPFDPAKPVDPTAPPTGTTTTTPTGPAGATTADPTSPPNEMPVLKRATFELDTPRDTYLDMRAWGKGCVWINGHNLGRYWEIGPQQTIYVPAEWLKQGANEIDVFELLKPGQNELKTVTKTILDCLNCMNEK